MSTAPASPPIVLACDDRYAMPLATTLRSLVDANQAGWPFTIYVLSHEVSGENRKKVLQSLPQGSAVINWIPIDPTVFGSFATLPYISKMTYARLLIPTVIDQSIEKVLYLDSDILVVDDLRALWESDLTDAVVGAVMDEGLDAKLKAGETGLEEVPHVHNYFNAGVLLIDLKQWRRERISERALAYLVQHPRTIYMDQDALNVACDGKWKQLDGRWNVQAHARTAVADLGPGMSPAIVHFVTSVKPWNARTLSLNADFYDTFRSKTCFRRDVQEIISDRVKRIWALVKLSLKRYQFVRIVSGTIRQRPLT